MPHSSPRCGSTARSQAIGQADWVVLLSSFPFFFLSFAPQSVIRHPSSTMPSGTGTGTGTGAKERKRECPVATINAVPAGCDRFLVIFCRLRPLNGSQPVQNRSKTLNSRPKQTLRPAEPPLSIQFPKTFFFSLRSPTQTALLLYMLGRAREDA